MILMVAYSNTKKGKKHLNSYCMYVYILLVIKRFNYRLTCNFFHILSSLPVHRIMARSTSQALSTLLAPNAVYFSVPILECIGYYLGLTTRPLTGFSTVLSFPFCIGKLRNGPINISVATSLISQLRCFCFQSHSCPSLSPPGDKLPPQQLLDTCKTPVWPSLRA